MITTKKADSGASMAVPALGQKRLVIVGATGMVGGYAVRSALNNLAVKSVTSIGRKRLGITHPKLKEVLHQNFADCSPLADVLSAQDAVVYCLGSSTPGRYRTSNCAS
jgi:putative NADH-flavin reductase